MKPRTPPEAERLAALDGEAASWFGRLQAETVPASDRAAFDHWLSADPRHEAAWLRYEQLWSDLAVFNDDPLVAALRADALSVDQSRRPWLDRRVVGALAAALVVAVAVGAGAGLRWAGPGHGLGRQAASADPTFSTAIGQQAAFRLKDGSLVTLSTDSAVKVDGWGRERRLSLLRGQAYFQVAKDHSRPFVVTAGDKRVTAVGTAFDVRLDPDQLSVTLVEGRVRIAGPSPRGAEQMVEMSAGSRFIAPPHADWRIAQVDAAREASWLQGRVVFDGEPLSTVVGEMNRYSTRKLLVANAALGATPVSGVFKTGQVDAFVAAVESYGLVRVGRADDRQVELVSP